MSAHPARRRRIPASIWFVVAATLIAAGWAGWMLTSDLLFGALQLPGLFLTALPLLGWWMTGTVGRWVVLTLCLMLFFGAVFLVIGWMVWFYSVALLGLAGLVEIGMRKGLRARPPAPAP